jgi:hypothetical protein
VRISLCSVVGPCEAEKNGQMADGTWQIE